LGGNKERCDGNQERNKGRDEEIKRGEIRRGGGGGGWGGEEEGMAEMLGKETNGGKSKAR
jgi:hypothetical protein